MTRTRGRLAFAAATLVAALLFVFSAGAAPAPKRSLARPNIVVITTDDQTVESLRVMTNVHKLLAKQGTTFVNNFATFPLCCPSRATFLTGQYSHNHCVVGNSLTNGLYNLDESNTLPLWLMSAGYTTAFVGKYMNGYGKQAPTAIPPGWSEWYAGVTMAYRGHSMNRNGVLTRYGSAEASYQTDVFGRTAVDVVRRRAPESRPFFLWLSFFAPHAGSPVDPDDPPGLHTPSPALRHRNAFAGEPLPAAPSFDEEDVADKPAALRNRPLFSSEDVAAITENYQQRLESLLAVDEAVGQLVAELRASGELDRTVIVFVSDNGFFHGEHRVPFGKYLPYEPSIHVPLVVRGPGVPRGAGFGSRSPPTSISPRRSST